MPPCPLKETLVCVPGVLMGRCACDEEVSTAHVSVAHTGGGVRVLTPGVVCVCSHRGWCVCAHTGGGVCVLTPGVVCVCSHRGWCVCAHTGGGVCVLTPGVVCVCSQWGWCVCAHTGGGVL